MRYANRDRSHSGHQLRSKRSREQHAVVADIADFNGFGQQINPILNAANIASIGNLGLSASQLSAPNSFPLAGPEAAGQATVLADAGSTHIYMGYIDAPATAASVTLNRTALMMGRGLQLAGSIPVPYTAIDMTPYVAAATKGDGVALAPVISAQVAGWLKAAQEAGDTQKVSGAGIC